MCMKTSSASRRRGKRLDRSAAMACAGINLLATPGLGTLMAGRLWAGLAQLAVAVIGFVLVMIWMALKFWSVINGSAPPAHWWWQLGLPIFLAAWVASAWSSYDMWREAAGASVPPKLNES